EGVDAHRLEAGATTRGHAGYSHRGWRDARIGFVVSVRFLGASGRIGHGLTAARSTAHGAAAGLAARGRVLGQAAAGARGGFVAAGAGGRGGRLSRGDLDLAILIALALLRIDGIAAQQT